MEIEIPLLHTGRINDILYARVLESLSIDKVYSCINNPCPGFCSFFQIHICNSIVYRLFGSLLCLTCFVKYYIIFKKTGIPIAHHELLESLQCNIYYFKAMKKL